MADRTVSSPEQVLNVLSQLPSEAQANLKIARGSSENERIITVDNTYAAELASADAHVLAPSEEDVRNENARRLMATYGARDTEHLTRLINDGVREAVRLIRIGEANWTTEQAARAAQLEVAEAYVDAMDAASKALRAMQPIPPDYADDAHWPSVPGA